MLFFTRGRFGWKEKEGFSGRLATSNDTEGQGEWMWREQTAYVGRRNMSVRNEQMSRQVKWNHEGRFSPA